MGEIPAAQTFRSKGVIAPDPAHLIINRNGGNYALRLTSAKMGGMSFTSGAIGKIELAARGFNEAADALHESVNAWSSARRERSNAAVERLRANSTELADLIFPDGGTAFADGLLAKKKELVIVVSPFERIAIPWQLLWIAGRGQWLGEIASFTTAHECNGGGDFSGLVQSDGILAGYAEDDNLASARKNWSGPAGRTEEYSSLDMIAPGNVDVDPLLPFTSGPLTPAERDLLQMWLSAGRHIYHFACHAREATATDPMSAFFVRKSAEVSGNDFEAKMSPGAFMLNICSSAVGATEDKDSLAAALTAAGARGGIATTNVIADRFGTLFARGVYRKLAVNGGTLFDAFRTTQKQLLKRLGHPMALFYVMHGDTTYVLKE